MSSGKTIKTSYTFNNRPHLIKGGNDYFDTLKKLIDEAKDLIEIQVYIFEDDTTGKEITNHLVNAAQRGVRIQLLVDGYASRNLSTGFIETLQKNSIQFRFFEPIFKSRYFYFGRRLHHKVVVIDGTRAMVGGINISDRYNDLPGHPAWLDYAVLVEGEVAFELHKLCQQFFFKRKNVTESSNKINLRKLFNYPLHCPVRIRRNDWVMNKNQISGTYMEMFRNAQREITLMSSYFIPNKFFRIQIAKALRRGIKINLIVAGKSDVAIAKNAERYFYRWALRNGIHIYEYTRTILHSKLAICDDRIVTIGSYNINDISAFASIELNLDIEEKGFAKEVANKLEKVINQDTIQIKKEDIQNNFNLFDQFFQWLSYTMFRLVFKIFTFYFSKKDG